MCMYMTLYTCTYVYMHTMTDVKVLPWYIQTMLCIYVDQSISLAVIRMFVYIHVSVGHVYNCEYVFLLGQGVCYRTKPVDIISQI